MRVRLHLDELQMNAELARKLVDNEFPQYANLSLKELSAHGSSNVHYALGNELLIRFPRLPGGGETIVKECRWTRFVGSHLPVDVPELLGIGAPAFGYGEQWSIIRWQVGEHPGACSPADSSKSERFQLAIALADIVLALRNIEVSVDARSDRQLWRPYRGRPLADYDLQMRRNIENCRSIEGLDLDLDLAQTIWQQALALPAAAKVVGRASWFHGDIVAENLLLRDGRLTGLLDFGGMGLGDPTIDLHGAWELFDTPAREEFRSRLGVEDQEWERGRAWALAVALMTLPYYWTSLPNRIADRLSMVRSVLADCS